MKYQATQVMIAFSIEGDREQDLISLLQTLVQIALLFWGCWTGAARKWRQLKGCWEDLREAARAAAVAIDKLWSFEVSFTPGVG
jgi:hypothetical protein